MLFKLEIILESMLENRYTYSWPQSSSLILVVDDVQLKSKILLPFDFKVPFSFIRNPKTKTHKWTLNTYLVLKLGIERYKPNKTFLQPLMIKFNMCNTHCVSDSPLPYYNEVDFDFGIPFCT